jgi:hyaluronan synthase
MLLLGFGAATVYYLQPDFSAFNESRINSPIGSIFLILTVILLLFKASFLAYNIYLYFQYTAIESVQDDLLPTCTVIVPAYNEGNLVFQTLLSIANSDFPKHKLQILAIDDRSKDDTWYWIKKAKEQLGDQIVVVQQTENKGKRHALYRGFNLGTSEIFVTIDSDSMIKPNTF